MQNHNFPQTSGQSFSDPQTSTPSRQGRLALRQSGPPQTPPSLASRAVRPDLQPIPTRSFPSTNPGTSSALGRNRPSTDSDLSPVPPPNDHEELLYHKPSKQRKRAESISQPASSTRRPSKRINLSASTGSTSATKSQRCVSAPSLDVFGRPETSSEVSRQSAKQGSQNHVTVYSSPSHSLRAKPSFRIDRIKGDEMTLSVSTPGSTRATPIDRTNDGSDGDIPGISSSLAGNSMEVESTSGAENPDSPSPKPRRPVKEAQGLSSSSTTLQPVILSNHSALSRSGFTVPSDDSSGTEDEVSGSESLDDSFVEDLAISGEDTDHEPVEPASTQPLPFRNFRTGGHRPSRETNEAIRDLIINHSKCNRGRRGGFIYAMQCSTDASSYLKIGKTCNVPEKRFRTWSKKCRRHFIVVVDPSPSSPSLCNKDAFLFYGLVESIIKQEFHNQRKKYFCEGHGYAHNEWFDVSPETAYRSINRWRTWLVVEKPFDKLTGKLKPYWQWKVDNMNQNYSTLDWDDWTKPSLWDWGEYKLGNFPRLVLVLKHLKRKDKHFWMMACALSSLGYFLFDGPGWRWWFFLLSLLAV